MGHVTHHAIVVTTWNPDLARAAHAVALNIGLTVTPAPTESPVNGYRTFLVVPDGSKTDWAEDSIGDGRRERFKDWLRSKRDSDGGNSIEWVECCYGSDDALGNGDMPTISDHEWVPIPPLPGTEPD